MAQIQQKHMYTNFTIEILFNCFLFDFDYHNYIILF